MMVPAWTKTCQSKCYFYDFIIVCIGWNNNSVFDTTDARCKREEHHGEFQFNCTGQTCNTTPFIQQNFSSISTPSSSYSSHLFQNHSKCKYTFIIHLLAIRTNCTNLDTWRFRCSSTQLWAHQISQPWEVFMIYLSNLNTCVSTRYSQMTSCVFQYRHWTRKQYMEIRAN